ncbi:hepatocellular carcinoma-associated antigen 59-domain-containing protein [Phellopilus nigrolimitatus]|nr:hepatocellular carcinoma-associated antigen 59-domain-containing protein [Phellopilus nigrolimitatus]
MSSEPTVTFKKRNRPAARTHERTHELDQEPQESAVDAPADSADDNNLPLDELLELRRLRRLRQGIDIAKLNKGEPRKKKKATADDATTTPVGLIKAAKKEPDEEEGREFEESKARRVVRNSNFTGQTNALDVDKHMMAYIEENMKMRRGGQDETSEEGPPKPLDDQDELFRLPDKYRAQNAKALEEGSVTNSLSMLTAIPEVDLGMDTRLKNIEETEKAKRLVADARKEKRKNNDEEHLAATRFFKPNLKHKSDADIIRDAKLDAMGLRPENHEPRRNNERSQTATDEMVMERFKKRMRR